MPLAKHRLCRGALGRHQNASPAIARAIATQRAASSPSGSHVAVSGTAVVQGSVNVVKTWDQGHFCRLCREPFGAYLEHIGKRDHISLELFFNVIVEHARAWNPNATLADFTRRFSSRVAVESLFGRYDVVHRERRTQLLGIMRHLVESGVLYLGPAQWRDPRLNAVNMGHNGALVLFWMQHPQIIHLFPRADAAQIASFSQVCYSMYSLETVFDFLGMSSLVDVRDIAAPGQSEHELTWFDKSIILRNMLGQIRWAMDGGHRMNHPIAARCDPHVAVLCEELGHGLVTETLFCRTCEFVCRADKVWRELGCPTAGAAFSGTVRDITKHGALDGGRRPGGVSAALPGTRDHQPMSATENAIQMINACYHSGLTSLLGPSRGDVAFRSGGESFGEATRAMRYASDARLKVADGLAAHAAFQSRHAGRAKPAAAPEAGSSLRPPLSRTAERLLSSAAHLSVSATSAPATPTEPIAAAAKVGGGT